MEAPFNLEEICKVVFGSIIEVRWQALNDFMMAFLQDKWDCLKNDLWKVFSDLYERGTIASTQIKLLVFGFLRSKKKVREFRPIILVTFWYLRSLLRFYLIGWIKLFPLWFLFLEGLLLHEDKFWIKFIILNEVVEDYMRHK